MCDGRRTAPTSASMTAPPYGSLNETLRLSPRTDTGTNGRLVDDDGSDDKSSDDEPTLLPPSAHKGVLPLGSPRPRRALLSQASMRHSLAAMVKLRRPGHPLGPRSKRSISLIWRNRPAFVQFEKREARSTRCDGCEAGLVVTHPCAGWVAG